MLRNESIRTKFNKYLIKWNDKKEGRGGKIRAGVISYSNRSKRFKG